MVSFQKHSSRPQYHTPHSNPFYRLYNFFSLKQHSIALVQLQDWATWVLLLVTLDKYPLVQAQALQWLVVILVNNIETPFWELLSRTCYTILRKKTKLEWLDAEEPSPESNARVDKLTKVYLGSIMEKIFSRVWALYTHSSEYAVDEHARATLGQSLVLMETSFMTQPGLMRLSKLTTGGVLLSSTINRLGDHVGVRNVVDG